MHVERQNITLTTNGSGACTAASTVVTGRVIGVHFTVGTIENTADVTVTAEATSEPILVIANLAASGFYYPAVTGCNSVGAALTYNGTQAVTLPVHVANDRIQFVVAQGGASKTGTATIVIA